MSNPNVTIDRYKYVGGSDLPNILGFNMKYGKSVFEFAKQKAGIIPNDFKGNEYTKYGQVMEAIIRDYINAKYSVNYLEDTCIDKDRNYRGNTDGIDRDAEIPILEIKTFGEALDVEYYTPQCQFYMEVFNQPACRLVGYKRPKDFYTGIDYEMENDDTYFNFEFDENNIEEVIILRDKDYWSKIEFSINKFKEAVIKLRENNNMSEKEFNDIFMGNNLIALTNKISNFEKQLATLKTIDKKYKEAKEELYNIFEERGLISFDLGTVKLTKVAPTSYDTVSIDTKKLKENEPKIYEEYKVIKTTNRKGYMLITFKDGVK